LCDSPDPVIFVSETEEILLEWTYRCPTIINAKVTHGVPIVNSDRIFLQIKIDKEWDYVKEHSRRIFKN
jgi:hypothetical protein